MQIAPAGDRALLVTLGDVTAAELHGAAAALRSVERVIACVPGHSSVLVVFEGEAEREGVKSALQAPHPVASSRDVPSPGGRGLGETRAAPGSPPSPDGRGQTAAGRRVRGLSSVLTALHPLPTTFDGPDLDEFLAHTSQTRDDFLQRVDGLTLTVRYLGFRGGFAYLDGWPAEWAMPRRATSRPVKKGSFGIAGAVAGFYPIDSPGGWNILGRTDEELENRFRAGDEIRITRR